MATLHYASGDNFNSQGTFTPAQAGFNLADVSSVDQLNSLPDGVKGLVWLDKGDGVTQDFIDAVTPYIGNDKLFGFFLKDEPDPTGQWNTLVTAADLKAESDWIHANVPGAKTFITMMNMGSSDNPSFANTYTPENTHIDLFGLDPYPVRTESSTVDYNMIDRTVAAATNAGIPLDKIVPVYQTFGGGGWVTDGGGKYVLPDATQAKEMFAHWDALVPNAAFDYAYAWGEQNGDVSLSSSSTLQNAFLQHNTSTTTTVEPTTPTTPVVSQPEPTDPTPVVSQPAPTDSEPTTPVVSQPAPTDSEPTTPVVSQPAPTDSEPTTPVVSQPAPTGSEPTTPVVSQPAPTDPTTPTTSPTASDTDHHHHGHGHGLDFSKLLGSAWTDAHSNPWAQKLMAVVNINTAATTDASSSEVNGSAQTNVDLNDGHSNGGHGNDGHSHQLDFSKLLDGTLFGDHNPLAAKLAALVAPPSAATDTAPTEIRDLAHTLGFDLNEHSHAASQAEHHWHW